MQEKRKRIACLFSIIFLLFSLGNYMFRVYAEETGTMSIAETKDQIEADQEETKEQDETIDQMETTEQNETTDQVETTEQNETIDQTEATEETAEENQQPEVYTGKIAMETKKLSLKQGKSYKLNAKLTKDNPTSDKLSFKSSNNKIIKVNQKGVIKALHWGEATVTVSLGKVKAVCKVTVTKDVTITISAAGDCTLSSDIKQPASVNFFSVYNKQKDNSYFFRNVKSIFEKDDMTIVNFEGTLSSRGTRVDKHWAFRGKPSYINILKEGSIEAVAFANNHVRDYGEVSYEDTISGFEKANIAYSSYSKIDIYEVKGIKIGMISIQEAEAKNDYEATLRNALKAMKKKNPDLLIVNFHWGIERTSNVTKSQTKLSRIAIDEGEADLVLGHHPHVLQPIEKYKDSYIVYSLGNFSFGGNTNPPDKDTMIYQQTFTFHNDKLVPDDEVKIIPCSISSSSKINNYQPTKSKGSEKSRILKKINSYCKQYGISFDANGKIQRK